VIVEGVPNVPFEEQIQIQLTYWQRILRMQDWVITVEIWPHNALDGAVAHITTDRNQKAAVIALRHPNDIMAVEKGWPENEAADYDLSIVHELLHLKCVDLETDEQVEWAEEQLCNHVSKALVSLYRGKEESPASVNHGHYL